MTQPTLFKITDAMVEASTTLDKRDVGLWCYIYRGRYHGFCGKAEAYKLMGNHLKLNEIALRD